MRFGKILALITTLSMFVSIISACGNEDTKEAVQSSQQTSESTADTTKEDSNLDPNDPYGFGRYKEPVVITIGKEVPPEDKSLPEGDTAENNQYTRYIEEVLNIKFEYVWQASGDAFLQKVRLATASNDLPDALMAQDSEFRQMVKADQLEDLQGVYDQYANDVLKKRYSDADNRALKTTTFDGKLLAIPDQLPQGDCATLLWVRQDWLDQFNLEPPKTLDDVINIAKTFMEKDPDGNKKADTIGLLGNPAYSNIYNNTFGLDAIFGSFGSYPAMWLKDGEGKLTYGSIMPETKLALEKLSEMYKAGIIDREYAMRQNPAELVVSGKCGLFFGPWWLAWWPLTDSVKNDPKADWKTYLAPVNSEGMFSTRMRNISSTRLVVKKGFEHPEALIKYVNLVSAIPNEAKNKVPQLDPSVNHAWYPLRIVVAKVDEVEEYHTDIVAAMDGKISEDVIKEWEKQKVDCLEAAKADKLNPKGDMTLWANGFAYVTGAAPLIQPMNKVHSLFYGQTKTSGSTIGANLMKTEDETFTKIIMGELPISAFDSFVEDWKKNGGNQILKEIEEEISMQK